MFKTTKDMFHKQFDFFLRIDKADYVASWTLSFIWVMGPVQMETVA